MCDLAQNILYEQFNGLKLLRSFQTLAEENKLGSTISVFEDYLVF